jgi:hypothetical protein
LRGAFSLDDATFADDVENLEEQFKARAFVIPAVMLHVFGLRLFLSEIGAISLSKAQVVHECTAYVDSLRKNGELKHDYDEIAKMDVSRLGDVLFQSDSSEFKEILKYYNEVLNIVAKEKLPQEARNILLQLKTDTFGYARSLFPNAHSIAKYFNIPILSHIDADAFVNVVLGLAPENQILVLRTFKYRYETGMLQRELNEEISWLKQVRERFVQRATSLKPISRYRILTLVKSNIDPYICT